MNNALHQHTPTNMFTSASKSNSTNTFQKTKRLKFRYKNITLKTKLFQPGRNHP